MLESLAGAGAFDAFEENRARVFAGVDMVLRQAQHAHESASVGQNELFGGGDTREPIRLPQVEPWLPPERLQREREAVGFYLSGHPLDDYAVVLKKLRVQSWADFSHAVKNGITAGRVAATVVSRTERRTRTGNKMGIIELSDPTGTYEAVIFSEGLAEYRDLLEPGTAVLMFLSAEVQGDEVRARIQSVEPLDAAAANLHKGLRVFLRDDKPLEAVAKRLEPVARHRRAQRRRRGLDGAAIGGGHRGRGEAARPLQGLAADRRRAQGGARGGAGRGAVVTKVI